MTGSMRIPTLRRYKLLLRARMLQLQLCELYTILEYREFTVQLRATLLFIEQQLAEINPNWRGELLK